MFLYTVILEDFDMDNKLETHQLFSDVYFARFGSKADKRESKKMLPRVQERLTWNLQRMGVAFSVNPVFSFALLFISCMSFIVVSSVRA